MIYSVLVATIDFNTRRTPQMQIQPTHPNFIMPTKGTQGAGAWDLYMPEDGKATTTAKLVDLGFCAAIPPGFVGLMFPRSGIGSKKGFELNNTCGVIDSDYRGTWKASIRVKRAKDAFEWKAGERVLQVLLVPAYLGDLTLVQQLDETQRGAGGFGSSGT